MNDSPLETLRDLDSDGRILQEFKLMNECRRLTLGQLRTLTFFAQRMQEWTLPDTETAERNSSSRPW